MLQKHRQTLMNETKTSWTNAIWLESIYKVSIGGNLVK